MLRNNFDRLRNESHDARARRDAREYYFDENEQNYSSNYDSRQDVNRNRDARRDRDDQQTTQRAGFNDFGSRYEQSRNEQQNNLTRYSSNQIDEQNLRYDKRIVQSRDNNVRAHQVNNSMQNYSHDTERDRVDTENERLNSNSFYGASDRIYGNNQIRDQRNSHQREVAERNFNEQVYQNHESQNRTSQTQDFSQNFSTQLSSNQNVQPRSLQSARACDIMSRNVVTVSPNDTAQHAARLMRDCDCGAVPIVNRDGRIIGMVTDRDITVRLVASGVDPRATAVQNCMTDQVFACHENDSLESCISLMSHHQVRRVIVIDNQNHITGIISQGDLARYAQNNRYQHDDFARMLGEISEPSRNAYR